MDDLELKAELARVVALLARGAEALLTFKGSRGIVRDSGKGTVGLTSSHRTLAALAEAQRVLRDEGALYRDTCGRLSQQVMQLWNEQYVPRLASKGRSGILAAGLRKSADNGINLFTDAHLVCALGYVGTSLLPVEEAEQRKAKALRGALATSAGENLARHSIGKIGDDDPGHDFVTLWAVRSVDAVCHRDGAGAPTWGAQVGKRVRDNVLRQLGWHAASVGARFDPGELAFGLPLLQRFSPDEARTLAARGIEVMAGAQTTDGAWPGSRIVNVGTSLLHISSYEVALTLATWLDQRQAVAFGDDSTALVDVQTLQVLRRTFRLAETSYTDEAWEREDSSSGRNTELRRGWSNDRTRGQGRVESWVTAIVVAFLARYYDVLSAHLQRQLLTRYEARWPHPKQSHSAPQPAADPPSWPDQARSFGRTQSLPVAAELLRKEISDPTDNGKLADLLAINIVDPILDSPNLRPRPNSLSFVLPGPPGSRKTSLVASIAAALQWPLVVVSPPTFLLEGLDGLERRAAQVFEDLSSLRRTVILFDECEELFRDRQSNDDPGVSRPKRLYMTSRRLAGSGGRSGELRPSAATRTAGAFITTGMLPRLQALHDRAWSVFALAFNGGLADLDPAAIRPGRFDFTLPLAYPGVDAQVRYVRKQQLSDRDLTELESALRQWCSKGNETLPWVVLNELIACCNQDPAATSESLLAVLAGIKLDQPPELPNRVGTSNH